MDFHHREDELIAAPESAKTYEEWFVRYQGSSEPANWADVISNHDSVPWWAHAAQADEKGRPKPSQGSSFSVSAAQSRAIHAHRTAGELSGRMSRLGELFATTLPRRIAQEEWGDYLEQATRQFANGRHLSAWIHFSKGALVTAWNAALYLLSRVGKDRRIG